MSGSKRALVALGSAAVIAVVLPSASAAQQQVATVATATASATTPPPAAAVNAGRTIFHGQGGCFVCHGEKLEGGPIAPTLRAHPWKDAKDGTLDAILSVVMHGVPGTAMVSHPNGISDAEAARVAAYVWAVSHGVATP